MKDTFKQFIQFRTQAISANDTYVTPALIRKLTPEQLDRLSNISPPGSAELVFTGNSDGATDLEN